MKKPILTLLLTIAAVSGSVANSAIVNIDLSGASTGTLIAGSGGSFAQTFSGQSVVGTGISGSPTGPLSLAPSGSITVAAFDPGVSPSSNSLLPQPGNAAPLSLLLGSDADSLTWTMGFGNGGSVTADLFSLSGTLISTSVFGGLTGYSVFNLASATAFRGVTFRDNNDAAGLRYQNFSYNSVVTAVPEPATLTLLGLGLAGLGLTLRRRRGV